MNEKHSTILALLEILRNESDEDHPITRDQILTILDYKYNIQIERKTLYRQIKLLQTSGIDVSDYVESGKGYYLSDRQFEPSEINLLCHSVHSSHIIPEKNSKQLIDKLLATQNKYEQHNFKNHVYAINHRKTTNLDFFLNIEILLEAIKDNKKISFSYMKYDLKKNLVSNGKEYIVSPFDIVYLNECCYLIAQTKDYHNYSHYRIDRMKDINIIEGSSFSIPQSFNNYDYAKSKLYMYSGDDIRIKLKCHTKILNDIIDTFGTETMIQKYDDATFFATINSSETGVIYWALQFIEYCEILEPQSLRDKMLEQLEAGVRKYKVTYK